MERRFLAATIYFEEIHNRESVALVRFDVLQTKIEPLGVSFGVQIVAQVEFIFEFTPKDVMHRSQTNGVSLTLEPLSSDCHSRSGTRKVQLYRRDFAQSLMLVDNLHDSHRYEIA